MSITEVAEADAVPDVEACVVVFFIFFPGDSS